MITLKDYQVRALDALRDFFRQCSQDGRPEAAFQAAQVRAGRAAIPYLPISATGLATGMPYICLRVPTGGGKTLLACHSAGLAMSEFLHAERAVVLWLVPSNAILSQTADALRDPHHPYRRALESAFGAVEVVTIDEALRLSRPIVDGQSVIIVATIQSFRVEETAGRKVYEQNGSFIEHFLNVDVERLQDLLLDADGRPRPSLVNMLCLRRPIVIVDEAHNARTDLSFATLGNIRPACIVEFTATPARATSPSNVLYQVSAAELKAADMIKLPLRVITRHPSQREQLLADAITLRADLERIALQEGQNTGEYLRPILLIQAERVDACEPLRERLVTDFGIAKDNIKISTGELDELKGIADISSPQCPVRVILTVQRLREGWDCPFAYVLCSLRETRSATAIEQIVGRILRLPRARAKEHPDLNSAYAFSVSPAIGEVLAELRAALEANGFTSAEAERIVIPISHDSLYLGLDAQTATFEPGVVVATAVAIAESTSLGGKVQIDVAKGTIAVLAALDESETVKLAECVATPEAKATVHRIAGLVREAAQAYRAMGLVQAPTPQSMGRDFAVPVLCVSENGELFEFESTFLMDPPLQLSKGDASLSESYNPLKRPHGQQGTIDISASGRVATEMAVQGQEPDFVSTLHQQVLALAGADDWPIETLIAWLDKHIAHQDIPLAESAEFTRLAIRGIMARFGIADVGTLVLDRFRLRDAIEQRIQQQRTSARERAFQLFLLPDSPLAVTEQRTINFRTVGYEPRELYSGGFQFKKHYFGPRPGDLPEMTTAGTLREEFQCAQYLDGLPEIDFWVRNISQRATSFRLLTTTDWFYPDFVGQLKDGRSLVIEYKGKDRYSTADSEEKRAIGAVWASRSDGSCVFAMPTDLDFSVIAKVVRPV